MGLPGVHSKFWLHQSSVAVSYLPYQPLHFTTLHWSGPSSPEVQLLIPSNDLSLLCACGRTCRSIHPSTHHSSTHLSICPSSHPTTFLFSHPFIYLPSHFIYPPSQSSFHSFIHPPSHLLIHPFFKPSMYSLIHTSNTHCSHTKPGPH